MIASLALDHSGWLRMEVYPMLWARAAGALLLVGGVTLIAETKRLAGVCVACGKRVRGCKRNAEALEVWASA